MQEHILSKSTLLSRPKGVLEFTKWSGFPNEINCIFLIL
jgi:hypothetical protein